MKKVLLSLGLCASFLLANNFTLTSSDLKGQLTKKQEFNGFGCSGENISPQLSWENAPIHALDIETLGLDKNTNAATVGYYINSHSIAKASIISYYNR
ncbi:hypothetical protein ACOTVK_02115 [Aliarcobacter butzleri]